MIVCIKFIYMHEADAGYCGDELLIKIELKRKKERFISKKEHDFGLKTIL